MSIITIEELLKSGVHFGHKTRRWNPKMKPYIWGSRSGIYIIDVYKTADMFQKAYDFIFDVTSKGQKVLFVGTKKQASDVIYEEANRAEMYYIQNRWLGGMLTNFNTIKKTINRFLYLNKIENDGSINRFTKKEQIGFLKERDKLNNNIGGISSMKEMPGVLFIVDIRRELIAIKEAQKLGIPVVAIVDTNCDPDGIDYLVPGNDDAVKTIKLFTSKIADACIAVAKKYEAQRQAIASKKVAEEKEKKLVKKVVVAKNKATKDDDGGVVVKKKIGIKKIQVQKTTEDK